MFPPSIIELDRNAFLNNIRFVQELVGPNTRISSVVKGNAYGHGIEEIVPLVEEAGIDHISVFHADEALRVSKVCKEDTSIMIMGLIDNEELFWAIENEIEFYVFEVDRLQAVFDTAEKLGKKARIHFQIETGMNRMGFTPEELSQSLKILKANRQFIEVMGICTHFAGAEHIANYVRVHDQYKRFKRTSKWLKKHGFEPKYEHVASSAATISYPKTRLNMVRVGILQYGFWPSPETFIGYVRDKEDKSGPLKRVISWKSKVMNVKEVQPGEFIGYGTSYMARKKMKVATVPVGYADGYSRSLSNQGRVLINGARVSVVGTVNMNMLITDITDIPNTKKGDEVVLIGDQGELKITVASFGEMSDHLNYELLTKISTGIPRLVVH